MKDGQERVSTTQGVSDAVASSRNVLDHECKLLEIGYPRGMSSRYFILSAKMLKGVMISVKDKFLVEQVMPPMLDCLHNSIELDVIRTITKTRTRYLFPKESYRPVSLAKDSANPTFRRIAV